MPGTSVEAAKYPNVEAELYFLIAKFLRTGPCENTAQALRNEIEEHKLMPKRVDWLGNEHDRSFNDLERCYPHIADNHLLKICSRIGPILDKEFPSNIPGVHSLLGAGRQSLLRCKDDCGNQDYTVRRIATLHHGAPVPPSVSGQSNFPPNITKVLVAREHSGPFKRQQTLSCKSYSKLQRYRRLLGHLSSVYCVLYDRTGRYIFTGADDLLVKIWSARDGRLLATLRGHSAEITDMAVNYENTLLAASSCDKLIRVWCLQTLAPVAVLVGHTGMVTSLQFCPYSRGDKRYLISTGNDGCVCFWQWSAHSKRFNLKPLKFTERNRPGAQMVCSSFSSGGVFLATGSTDHRVRVYNILGVSGPEKICEAESHSDRVDSLQFSNNSSRFISGSKDGTAFIWRFEKQQWLSTLLKMSTKLLGSPSDESDDPSNKLKLNVNMVAWSLDDSLVFTAVSDHSLKVWNSYTGQLIRVLQGHDDEVFVLETHPLDHRILLSGGHDGRIVIWDLVAGSIIKSFPNSIEGQGHGAVFDCKVSPDGMTFASTDSHGHISIFGYGCNDLFKKVPEEQFFHTDYRPLIRDPNHYVLDEQTQCPPHLMPAAFLVDIDGNPYPPNLQRLVPGRENCNDAQLIPYVAATANGVAEVLQPVRPPDGEHHRPTIDDMIERLQLEQQGGSSRQSRSSRNDHGAGPSSAPSTSNRVPLSPRLAANRSQPIHSPGHSRVGMRRDGDIEGVRQSSGTWHSRDENESDTPAACQKRMVVCALRSSALEHATMRRVTLADQELRHYNKEKRRRPLPPPTARKSSGQYSSAIAKGGKSKDIPKKPPVHTMKTRGVHTSNGHLYGEDFEDPDTLVLSTAESSGTTSHNEVWDEASEHSESDSGDSDWGEVIRQKVVRQKRRRSADGVTPVGSEDQDSRDSSSTSRPAGSSAASTSRSRPGESVSNIRRKANGNIQDLPEEYRPPEWLTSTVPSRTPFVPQIGDEVVYFHQGHNLYMQAVKRAKTYDISLKNQPWKKFNLRDQEVLRIIGVKYELRPPRLCCLTVAVLEPATRQQTGAVFNVVFHDMIGVIDFMVLKQMYDQAVSRNWKANDRFRSVIDNAWWHGTIQAQLPLHEEFPDSMFQCMLVLWDNGESERMSPWDFEPIDESRLPRVRGESISINAEERNRIMYCPTEEEWLSCGRDAECNRLRRGLEKIMEMRIAESFLAPVDLNAYPAYAMVIEYPMDLTTIRNRLKNKYYRRISSVRFDISYILINARKFNEPGSYIVKNAKKLTELLFKFVDDWHCDEPRLLHQEMTGSSHSRFAESDSELEAGSAGSAVEEVAEKKPNRKRKMESSQQAKNKKRIRLQNKEYTSKSWRSDCMEFIRIITECEDSTPFRRQVSLIEYPDYRDIVDHPMDLSKIREKLSSNQYQSPVEFCKDMRLMFQNSRNYNTNKKSRIYSMTIRLSAMFEDQIRFIISDYRSALKYEEKLKNNQFVSDRRRPVPTVGSPEAGPSASTSRSAGRLNKLLPPSLRSSSLPSHQRTTQISSVSAGASPHVQSYQKGAGTSRIRASHPHSQNNSKPSHIIHKKESTSSESRNYQQLRSSVSTSTSGSSTSVKIKSGSSSQLPLGMYSSPQVIKAVGNAKKIQVPSMVTRRQALTEQNGRIHPHTRKNSLIENFASSSSAKRHKLRRILPHRQQPSKPFSSLPRTRFGKKNPLTSEGDDDEENESGKEVSILKRKIKKNKVGMSFMRAKLIKLKKAATKKKLVIGRPLTRSKSKVDEPSSSSRDSCSLEGAIGNRRRRTVVNYKELDEGPRLEEEEYGNSFQDSRTPPVSGSIRKKRTVANGKEVVLSFKAANIGASSSSHSKDVPEVPGTLRRKRTVASYKEADDEEEAQNSNSCSSASSLGRSERITRHSYQSSVNTSDSNAEFRSSRRISKKVLEDGKSQREVRWNLRNQGSVSTFGKLNDTLDQSDSSNSSRATSEQNSLLRSPGIQQQHQTRTHLKHHLATSPSGSGLHGDSHLSNTDDGGLSDDESGVRRSSRASTRNCTRATRSALIASSTDDLQEAPKQPLPMLQSTTTTSKGQYVSLKDLSGIETRSKGQRTVRYQEDSDFDYEAVDSEASMNGDHVDAENADSVSRGRRRKFIKQGIYFFRMLNKHTVLPLSWGTLTVAHAVIQAIITSRRSTLNNLRFLDDSAFAAVGVPYNGSSTVKLL